MNLAVNVLFGVVNDIVNVVGAESEVGAVRVREKFRARFDVSVELAVTATETENFPVMSALRDVELTAADMAFVNGTA